MKKNIFLPEIIISAVLIILLILLLDPFMYYMPTPLQMIIITLVLLVFASFSAFVWREKARDEREQLHINIASRFSYLAGVGILIAGTLYQTINHNLDPWLIIALIVMMLAKIIGILYANSKH